jgi:O-antigen/teichoic acid export membrane protein
MLSRLFGLIAARILSPMASFLIVVLVARIWGKTELGQYQTILVWLAIFQFIPLFGMGEYITRAVGKDLSSGSKYLIHGLLFGVITSLICMVAMAGGAALFKYPDEVKHGILIAALVLPFVAISLICQAVFTAFQKIKYITIVSLLENFFIIGVGLKVVYQQSGLIKLIWVIVIGRMLASALNLYIASDIIKLRAQIDWKFFRKLLPPVAVFGLTGVAFQLFMRVDIIMLSRMTDMASVGLYSSASKLWEICLMLPIAFYVLNLPVAAQGYKNFRGTVQQKIEDYTKSFFIFIFLVFGFGTLFAESSLQFIYGQSFIEAAWIFRILMLSFLIQSGEMVLGMSCQAAGYHKEAMHVALFRAASNIVFNLIFIPIWGLAGAAFATLFSILLSFLIFHFFVRKALHDFRWTRIAIKPSLICLLIMLLLLPLMNRVNYVLLWAMFLFGYGLMVCIINGYLPLKTNTSSSG